MIWTHHAFLDEELSSLQGPGYVLAKSLALRIVQDLQVEGANLQSKKHRKSLLPQNEIHQMHFIQKWPFKEEREVI